MRRDEQADLALLAEALQNSGYFADVKSVAQAAVKILAGRELGLGPVESMRALHIVQGKVELSADLLAARVKLNPHYDYRILVLNEAGCSIEFFQDGESLGCSDFVDADRARAKLTGQTWEQYPRNMMFARAMSNGVAWYCPDVASGARLYVDGEIDTDNEHPPFVTPELVEPAASAAPVLATVSGDQAGGGATHPSASGAAERPEPEVYGEGTEGSGEREEAGSATAGVAPPPPDLEMKVAEPHEHVAGPKRLASGKPLCKVCGAPFKPEPVSA